MQVDDMNIRDDRVLHVGRMNYVVRSRRGPLVLNRFSPIGRSVGFYGEHAENELAVCLALLAEGDTVLDIGAHQGTHSIAFAKAVGPRGTVVAVEPQRLMLQNVAASASLNDLANIWTVRAAVGDTEGKVRIAAFDYGRRAHFSGMRIREENAGETVPLRRIDHIVEELEVPRPVAFMKIDIEGMELEALRGARDVLEADRPVVYLEYRQPQGAEIATLLAEFGYRGYVSLPRGFNPNNHFGHPEDRFGGGTDENALFVAMSAPGAQDRLAAVPEAAALRALEG